MAEKDNKKETTDPAYKYIKPTFKGSDPAYKYIKSESKDKDPAFKYINNKNNSFVDKFKQNFKANLKKGDQDPLDKKNITNNIDPAYKYIKQSDKSQNSEKNQQNNDNIEAQKRLLGSIKNIGKAIKGKDNKRKNNWKSQLDHNEKEFLNLHPGPNFENYESFLIRYKKHSKILKGYPEKFTKQFLEPAQEAIERDKEDWKKELIEPEEKNFLFRNPGPAFEDLDSFKKRFNSYKSKKNIEEKKIDHKNTPKKLKSIDEIGLEITKEIKSDLNEVKENIQTNFTCFYCSAPMSVEDLFCGECGKPKKIYEVETSKVKTNFEKKIKRKNKKVNLNNLPIETLENLKSLFEDDLIKKNEYDLLRKSILKISNKNEEKSKIDSNIKKIELIDKDKLIELKSLFDNNLIETDEYEALRKDLLKIL